MAEDFEPFLRDYGKKLVKIKKENISGVGIDYIDKLREFTIILCVIMLGLNVNVPQFYL